MSSKFHEQENNYSNERSHNHGTADKRPFSDLFRSIFGLKVVNTAKLKNVDSKLIIATKSLLEPNLLV